MTVQIERAVRLIDVAPQQLVVGDNVRATARLDDEFVASIRERGVLEPIVAYYPGDAANVNPVVLYGQRRTLAAQQVGLDLVSVVLVLAPQEVDRLVDQLSENDHRAPLTVAERVAAFQQLEAIGLSAFEIAKRTANPVEHVGAALEVAASRTAVAAATEHTALSLEQAAGIAEFDTDPDAAAALVTAATEGRFDHVLQARRDDRDQAERHAEVKAELEADGVTVVDPPAYGDKKIRRLSELLDDKGKELTAAKHRKCPGAAVCLKEQYDGGHRSGWKATPVCLDVPKHGHKPLWGGSAGSLPAAEMTEEQRVAAAAERRDVIDSNKAWAAAETVRREWLRAFIGRKTAPKGTPAFIATALVASASVLADVMSQSSNRYARELLGVKPYAYGQPDELAALVAAAATDARAQMLALTVVLAAHEDRTDRDAWRSPRPAVARYLRFLEANGYTLSEVELRACTKGEK